MSTTRYVPTYVNKDGMRTLMRAAQGRETFATPAAAQAWLDAVMANTSADTIRSIWGDNPRCEVRPVECWEHGFDPKGVWFDVCDHDWEIGGGSLGLVDRCRKCKEERA